MGKQLFIAEKPSVAMEFAKALGETMARHDGYQESEHIVITWCVGHLVTMSYPEVYDEKYRRWRLDTLPFLPDTFLYEIIPSVKKQFSIVASLLNRKDVDTIYVCTDSGREGEYIYRLVAQEAGVKGKSQKRVWIDSQTEEEIRKGIRTAKDLSAYDNLSAAAYLRAKEDYLMGINFSRLLTLKYGNSVASFLGEKRCVISVGRVMTCVLGMVVRREREIRSFVKTPFYRVTGRLMAGKTGLECEWRAVEGSAWYQSPRLYKENGFLRKEDAQALIEQIKAQEGNGTVAKVEQIQRKLEKKNAPLLYNLAELQNDCARLFRISPDQTLSIAQELYEKKLITYPRTDARVLSSAVAKQIDRNLKGLMRLEKAAPYAGKILDENLWQEIGKSRYTNDKLITDHYALIPTGQGLSALKSLSGTAFGVYLCIVRRFLGIFYPPAQYQKVSIKVLIGGEPFFCTFKILKESGYLQVMPLKSAASGAGAAGKKKTDGRDAAPDEKQTPSGEGGEENAAFNLQDPETALQVMEALKGVKKGSILENDGLRLREGETSPPRRYNSGTIILAMENAGQLIEDEELRAQIKGSGIGTSATRAEILKKLISNKYLCLNKKTQIITPSLLGELIYDVVDHSIRPLLNASLTASWEKGLTYVAEGTITPEEYMVKLKDFVQRRTGAVLRLGNERELQGCYQSAAAFYRKGKEKGRGEQVGEE